MPLIFLPHPILTTKAAPVYHYDPDLPGLIADMRQAMKSSVVPGAGLAANQVGHAKAVIITNFSPDVALNPLWEPHKAANKVIDREGCLSDPHSWYMVERYDRILAQWTNLKGVVCRCQLRAFQARVWQHEYDHLMGVNISQKGTRI